MYKVRFNLGRGDRYMKWKITNPDKEVSYLEPNEVSLTMYDCQLVNNSKTAKKIHDGANKRVCAYINCKSLDISEPTTIPPSFQHIQYNPRVNPFWTNHLKENIDGSKLKKVVSLGNKLWEDIDF